jgi:hypothetical protein
LQQDGIKIGLKGSYKKVVQGRNFQAHHNLAGTGQMVYGIVQFAGRSKLYLIDY